MLNRFQFIFLVLRFPIFNPLKLMKLVLRIVITPPSWKRRKGNLRFVYVLIISFIPFFVPAQKSKSPITFLPLPSFGYAPETRAYVGAVVLLTFGSENDSTRRSSNAKTEFNYTWNKQRVFENSWNVFGQQENFFSSGKVHYSYFPDLYYGIGNRTESNAEIQYQSTRLVLEANFLLKLQKAFFIGPSLRTMGYNQIGYLTEGHYPELYPSWLGGLGAMALLDARNHLLNPTKGKYLALTVLPQYFEDQWSSQFRFDFRTYLPLRKATLALRLMKEVNIGEVPFYAQALYGGDANARGYYYGRYRDKNLFLTQVEYRSGVAWKRWGYTLFGGVGDVYATVSELHFESLKPNAGLGVRFMIDRKENINLRLDYAIGKAGQSGFYISFGEAF